MQPQQHYYAPSINFNHVKFTSVLKTSVTIIRIWLSDFAVKLMFDAQQNGQYIVLLYIYICILYLEVSWSTNVTLHATVILQLW